MLEGEGRPSFEQHLPRRSVKTEVKTEKCKKKEKKVSDFFLHRVVKNLHLSNHVIIEKF